jgi:hypothetical protein
MSVRVTPSGQGDFQAFQTSSQGHCRAHSKVVPLEYSIEWLTCAAASRFDTDMVG